jgi:hypothetical protein
MEIQVARRDLSSEPAWSRQSVARAMARVAGALLVLAIVIGIPEAQRRVALLGQSAGGARATVLVGLAAVGVFLILYGGPAIWLLNGGIRFRSLALVGPFLTAGSFAITSVARAAVGGPRPASIEVAELLAFTAAMVVLLTGRPSRTRLRVGAGVGGLWLLLSVVRVVARL